MEQIVYIPVANTAMNDCKVHHCLLIQRTLTLGSCKFFMWFNLLGKEIINVIKAV